MTPEEIAEIDAFVGWWKAAGNSMADLAYNTSFDAWQAATAAERKRCAALARGAFHEGDKVLFMGALCEDIAHAIEEGKQP